MDDSGGGVTRRGFLRLVGQIGGSYAVHETMTAMGWLKMPEAWAGPTRLAPGSGAGQSVLVLGAGIGGLTTAYELLQAGYKVAILEPQDRAGGRSLTARKNTVITEESPEHGTTVQKCRFDDGLYLNMGPGRLPYHHRRVLHFCEILGVKLEPYIMTTTANLYQGPGFGGRAVVRRQLEADAQGYVAELLAKAVCKGSLDQELTAEERKNLLDLLVTLGDLNGPGTVCQQSAPACGKADSYVYCGSTRAGCPELTVESGCVPGKPFPLGELLQSRFWNGGSGKDYFYQPLEYEWQPTLFQPVGGMDEIVEGFKRKLPGIIVYNTEAKSLRLNDKSVEVEFVNRVSGTPSRGTYDWCVSNIPLPILQKIPANFAPDYKTAVGRGRFAPTCKVGWQAEQRFWESDQYQIYGGISYIHDTITQMWYPSNDYFTGKGTLTGAYNYSDNARKLGALKLDERLDLARQQGAKLHPEMADRKIVPQELGLSIAWQNAPFERGGWASWDPDSLEDGEAYSRLLNPDRRFIVVGDQVSSLPGWQEGAIMSAEHVVGKIGGIATLTAPHILRAPNSRRLTEGF